MAENELDGIGPVDFLIVEFPAGASNFTGEIAEEIVRLVEAGTIRVIDMIVITKDADGNIDAVEITDTDDLGPLTAIEAGLAGLLAEDDVAYLAASMTPGSVAGVLVYENLWAAAVRRGRASRRRRRDRRWTSQRRRRRRRLHRTRRARGRGGARGGPLDPPSNGQNRPVPARRRAWHGPFRARACRAEGTCAARAPLCRAGPAAGNAHRGEGPETFVIPDEAGGGFSYVRRFVGPFFAQLCSVVWAADRVLGPIRFDSPRRTPCSTTRLP